MEPILDRFIRYAKVHTTSKSGSDIVPSTQCQFDLAKMLKKELSELGLTEITLNDQCLLTAKLPSNMDKKVPAVAFFAHIDTAPDASGENVNPQVWFNYSGGDIQLSNDVVISPTIFPKLKEYVGNTIITADGTTLLGADDKAAIAEIMYMLEYYVSNVEIKHGDIWVGFTADEEVGLGVGKTDLSHIKADFAYTLDGEGAGEMNSETFNAASINISVKGRNVHPSTAKGKMLNALHIISEYIAAFPKNQRPEYTENYEGFYHLTALNGNVDNATATLALREFNTEIYEQMKTYTLKIAKELQLQYPETEIKCIVNDVYRNMGDVIYQHPYIIEIAKTAMEKAGLIVNDFPFRGGTDGSAISYMGIPCPNIFAGWHNAHGLYEYVSLQTMEKVVEVLFNIIEATTSLNQN